MHSDAVCNDVFEVGTAEKKRNSMWLNGAFGRYLTQCF